MVFPSRGFRLVRDPTGPTAGEQGCQIPNNGGAGTTVDWGDDGQNGRMTSSSNARSLPSAAQRAWPGLRDGLRAGLLAAVRGLAIGLLSLGTNIALFALAITALLLIPAAGLGFVAFPVVTALIRASADLQRRMASWSGVVIRRPYRPLPDGAALGTWARFRWVVSDPATWLDLAWLVPGAVTGGVLGLSAFCLPVYGLEGVLMVPVVLSKVIGWWGYGVFWPLDNPVKEVLTVPQGVLILATGLLGARWLLWLHAEFARFFLSPVRTAELQARVRQLAATRADVVGAQAAELRRIERDLHDGAQARLVSLAMAIGLAEDVVERDPVAAQRLLAEARESSGLALVELRHLVRGIHPPVLAERGLDGAVRALALTAPLPVEVHIAVPGRLPTPAESAAYFAIAETLANITKHSDARTASITVRHADGVLTALVRDDGAGGADPQAGTGLRGIERRLAAFDGTMTVSSPPGGPTLVTMELPCELSSPKTSPSSATD
jgi:signal transduction histidine kinase